MLRSILFISIAVVLATGFTFLTFNDPPETEYPPSAIFYPIEDNDNWLRIKEGVQVSAEEVADRYMGHLGLGLGNELLLYKTDGDNLGFEHFRYQQYYKEVKVQGGQFLIHEKNGQVETLNGKLVKGLKIDVQPNISKEEAIESALAYLPAERYMWEIHSSEQLLKRVKRDPSATYYPQPELVIADPNFTQVPDQYRLAYSLTVYAQQPEAQKWLFVDAKTGEVFHEINMLHSQVHNTHGVAKTRYHGEQEIVTDSVGMDSFRLVETTRGHGIYTYNLRSSTDSSAAVDFYDDDNYWDNVNNDEDEAATDAHWSAEMMFDYLLQEHNHIGVDGDSMELISMVHYGNNVTNAFWTGFYAAFGDGGNSTTPLTALDVVGHEFTHGVTRNTANLVYQDESGALNESFSDIFGTALEYWADQGSFDWYIGEDFLVDPFRNMADPREFGDPDTYFGDGWFTGNGDNGGVHTNSGVQNFWYFLLTEGKVDTNDLENPYTVLALGIDTASQIAFRNLKYYLTESSEYEDARFGAIQSASDIYGDCSFAVKQVMNAWYAVGVGPESPRLDVNVTAIIDPLPFDCNVSTNEAVTIEFIFRDCDTVLQAGAKIPVYYQVDGGTAIWDTAVVANQLAFGDTMNFTFSQPVSELGMPGIYKLLVGAEFENDNTPGNNVQEMQLERIFDQNVDLAVTDLTHPTPGCFIETRPVSVEIGFEGCDSIDAGKTLSVSYRLNGGDVVTEDVTIPNEMARGETFVHTFVEPVDLSEIKNHKFDAWANYAPDTLQSNDSLLAKFVVNPVNITLEDFITFEADMNSLDSFYFVTGEYSRAFLSEEAARDGLFGFQITGSDVVTAFNNGEVDLPTTDNLWDVNPEFRSKICFCADLTGLIDAEFKFRMKQTYSSMYANDFGLAERIFSAARVVVEGQRESNDYFPLGTIGSPYFNQKVDLEDYLGTKAEICIETSTLVGVEYDPYEIGDNVYIDNVTIVGTPNSVFNPLLPETAVIVYPNPNNGQFVLSIKNESAIDGVLKVTDALGRTIKEQQVNLLSGDNQLPLALDGGKAGLYYVQIISNGKKVVKEVVVH